jgi:hypothetical protein
MRNAECGTAVVPHSAFFFSPYSRNRDDSASNHPRL